MKRIILGLLLGTLAGVVHGQDCASGQCRVAGVIRAGIHVPAAVIRSAASSTAHVVHAVVAVPVRTVQHFRIVHPVQWVPVGHGVGRYYVLGRPVQNIRRVVSRVCRCG